MNKKERFKLIPAVYLVLRRGDKVLLSQRQNTGYQDGLYTLVSGHLNGGEFASHAMAREAKEEADITINPDDLTLVHTTHRLNGGPDYERIDLFFECSKWQGEIKNTEPHKCSDLSWFSTDDLPSNIIPHVRIVLDAIAQGKTYSEYEKEPEK